MDILGVKYEFGPSVFYLFGPPDSVYRTSSQEILSAIKTNKQTNKQQEITDIYYKSLKEIIQRKIIRIIPHPFQLKLMQC